MLRVLLIDDEPEILEILKSRLESFADEQFDIHTASDGKLGFEALIKQFPIDILITDNRMPTLMGHDVVTALVKGSRYNKMIPVLIVTGDVSSVKLPDDSHLKACVHVIGKPIDFDIFDKSLRAAIEYHKKSTEK